MQLRKTARSENWKHQFVLLKKQWILTEFEDCSEKAQHVVCLITNLSITDKQKKHELVERGKQNCPFNYILVVNEMTGAS